MKTKKSAYQVLGVARTASQKEIRRRYIELCKQHHPDTANQGNKDAIDNVDIREITAAYRQVTGKEAMAVERQRTEPGHRDEMSAEDTAKWTRWTLAAGAGLVGTVVAWIAYEPSEDISLATPPPASYNIQHHGSFRQWRKSS
ncbi:hypothetical protein BCR43DRAFT_521024 [Syncephalastrum racemosum]|uniref:J domain-containing protein n=1 Tax=Syncephalastrum racemosum TaxID=13706 RepID=A0A1X2HWN8_SYNRA|nr:hypothetical protein BCR43DRAFT_521024 [Syncephalastrum racemosum]